MIIYAAGFAAWFQWSQTHLNRRLERHGGFDRTRRSGRRLFLGRAGSRSPLSGRYLDAGRLFGRRRPQRHLSQSRHARRGDRDHLRSRADQLIARCSNSSSRSTIRRPAIARATMSARATARRSSTRATSSVASALDTIADVEASGLWPGKVVTEVAPAGTVLGRGARASGLSRCAIRTATRVTGFGRIGCSRSGPPRNRGP